MIVVVGFLAVFFGVPVGFIIVFVATMLVKKWKVQP
jgi:uncharacterized membrane protein YfcA